MRNRHSQVSRRHRGAAAVEFAFVAPVFMAIALGVSQVSQIFEVQNQLATAVREGARLAGMDRTDLLTNGQTTNAKIVADIANFLKANGLPGDQVEVFIVDPADHTTPLDLDDPTKELALFEVRAELPYSAINGQSSALIDDWNLSAKIVFRNGRAAIVQ